MSLIVAVTLVVVVAVALLAAAGAWIDAGADRQEGV